MKNANAAIIAVFLLVPAPARAKESCARQDLKIHSTEKALEEQLKVREEMNREFKSLLEQDFAAQAETVWDRVHRNQAVKVVAVRNRIDRKIDKLQSTLGELKKSYCDSCGTDPKPAYCGRCPEAPLCADAAHPDEPE